MTGELIIEKAKKLMKVIYPVDTPDFTFSIGWLGKFKARYGIKNFRHFGESVSVQMEGMEDKLKSIRDKVDQFEMKDIFNMDETCLFFYYFILFEGFLKMGSPFIIFHITKIMSIENQQYQQSHHHYTRELQLSLF